MEFESIHSIPWNKFKKARYESLDLYPEKCIFGKGIFIKTSFDNIFIEEEQSVNYQFSICGNLLKETVYTNDFLFKTETPIKDEEFETFFGTMYPAFGIVFHGKVHGISDDEELSKKLYEFFKQFFDDKKFGKILCSFGGMDPTKHLLFLSKRIGRHWEYCIDSEFTIQCKNGYFYLIDIQRERNNIVIEINKGGKNRKEMMNIILEVFKNNRLRILF